MPTFIEYLEGDQVRLAELRERDAKRLAIASSGGQLQRIAPDRLLFEHQGADLAALEARLTQLAEQVDVPLLWESLLGEEDLASKEATELAGIYFDNGDGQHGSAIFRALFADRMLFRRRGTAFTPRSADELAQLEQKQEAEQRSAAELAAVEQALGTQKKIDAELATRLERWVRGAGDRLLERATTALGPGARTHVCWRLIDEGTLPRLSDPEAVVANLKQDHSEEVVEHAQRIAAVAPPPATARAACSIDDPETREVDDALSATVEGELVRIDIDIADVAAHIERDDPVDLEALRRATTVYLPTGIFYMLPAPIGCGCGSLDVGQARRALRTSLWFDAQGEVVRHELARVVSRVERRLSYDEADTLLAGQAGADDAALAAELTLLAQVATQRRERRRERGALLLSRPEWKLRVDGEGVVTAQALVAGSRSRQLVAEMMIAANEAAAKLAVAAGLPLIFRTQERPNDPLPEIDPNDPGALAKLRGLLRPAALSVHPNEHWGLGLAAYTQVTSPLRRYGDLVQQRQLCAHIAGAVPPYSRDELLTVLAAVEGTEQEIKRMEAAVTLRWALEHVVQGPRKALPARVTAQVKTGYKVQLLGNGAEGLLTHRGELAVGQEIVVDVERVKPRRGSLRLALTRSS